MTPPTLDIAIEEAILKGANDAITILDALKKEHGDEWLKQVVAAKRDAFVIDRARDLIRWGPSRKPQPHSITYEVVYRDAEDAGASPPAKTARPGSTSPRKEGRQKGR